jgi:phage shock protein PspC (stress-responsive transcriptional regulator)
MHALGVDTTQETPRLVRRADHRLIAGVAGGLGDHFGVAPAWFRLGFVLAAFAGGIGVVAYLLLWFLIPRADLPASAAQQTAERFPDAPAWIGVLLIGIGILSLVDQLGLHAGAVGWALLLIGIGFLLFQRGGEERERDAVGSSTPSGPTVRLPAAPTPSPPRTRPPRERSVLGWLTVGLAMAAAGLVAVLRNTGALDLTLAQTLAVPLSILGAGLLVGTLVGRARWTVLLGLPLVPLVIAASAFTVPLTGRYGDVFVSRRDAQVQPSYTRSGGHVSLDLSRIDPGTLPPTIDVLLGVGSVDVTLPRRGVRVEATVNVGDVHMDRGAGGIDVRGTAGDPNASTVVRVHVDVGEVHAWTTVAPTPKGGHA